MKFHLSKLPFTGTVLQSTSPSYPTARPPAIRPGFTGGWSFGRLVISNFPSYSGVQIRSLGRHAFQAVGSANCVIFKHTSFCNLGRLLNYCVVCTLFFVRIWQPTGCGILFLNNHKNRNWPWTAVFIKNLPKPTANPKMETVTALIISAGTLCLIVPAVSNSYINFQR